MLGVMFNYGLMPVALVGLLYLRSARGQALLDSSRITRNVDFHNFDIQFRTDSDWQVASDGLSRFSRTARSSLTYSFQGKNVTCCTQCSHGKGLSACLEQEYKLAFSVQKTVKVPAGLSKSMTKRQRPARVFVMPRKQGIFFCSIAGY